MMFVRIGNGGTTPAQQPRLLFQLWKKDEPKDKWRPVFVLHRELGDAEAIPIQTFEEDRMEGQLALTLCRRGLRPIDSIEPRAGDKFVFGFAFEDGKNFYLAIDHSPIPIPLGAGSRIVKLSARSINRFQSPYYEEEFLLWVGKWNDVSLTRIEGDTMKFLKGFVERDS